MNFESKIISSVLDKNYSILMPTFFEMQTEYLASLNVIYEDLDASLVGMVLTNYLYKNKINNNGSAENLSFKNFYIKDNCSLPSSKLKINKIASIINVPRETVRRKRDKLIKDKIINFDKKNKLMSLNTEMIDKKILILQIENLSKFLSKFNSYFSNNLFLPKSISNDQIKKDLDKKFLLYLTKFLYFKILYFSNLKKIMDIESIFIILLCILNSTSQFKKENKIMNYKAVLQNIQKINKISGLNVSSISDITKIPRTTVIRKINKLENKGYLIRDEFKRYFVADLSKNTSLKHLIPIVDFNRNIIINFFLDCLETYKLKN